MVKGGKDTDLGDGYEPAIDLPDHGVLDLRIRQPELGLEECTQLLRVAASQPDGGEVLDQRRIVDPHPRDQVRLDDRYAELDLRLVAGAAGLDVRLNGAAGHGLAVAPADGDRE